jgi:hypothetical protein
MLGTVNKNLQKSEYKNFQITAVEQDWRGIQDFIPYNFEEVCFRLDQEANQYNQGIQASTKKDMGKPAQLQSNLHFKVALNQ